MKRLRSLLLHPPLTPLTPTPTGWDARPSQGYPKLPWQFAGSPFFLLGGDRHSESKVFSHARNVRCEISPLDWKFALEIDSFNAFSIQGFHGIEEEVFLSLPCVLGSHGIMYVIKQTLDENEAKKLQTCARTMNEIQQSLEFWVYSGCRCKSTAVSYIKKMSCL